MGINSGNDLVSPESRQFEGRPSGSLYSYLKTQNLPIDHTHLHAPMPTKEQSTAQPSTFNRIWVGGFFLPNFGGLMPSSQWIFLKASGDIRSNLASKSALPSGNG